ncbi:unnamed protein product [Rotaria socialis]
MCFADVVSWDTSLDQFRWAEGVTYQGMGVTGNDFSKYEVAEKVMNRSFLSTSKERDVADKFIAISATKGKITVLCTYNITDRRAALDTHSVSEFSDEQEVIIVPWMALVVNACKSGPLISPDYLKFITKTKINIRSLMLM